MVLRLCVVLGLAWLAQEAAGAPLAPAPASLGAAHASSVALLEPLAQVRSRYIYIISIYIYITSVTAGGSSEELRPVLPPTAGSWYRRQGNPQITQSVPR